MTQARETQRFIRGILMAEPVEHQNGTPDGVRAKVRQLFQFLREANQLRFKPIRLLSEHPKALRLADLPDHPSVGVFRPVNSPGPQEIPDMLLRVSRPRITHCPAPPASIIPWLLPNWDDPAVTAVVATSQNTVDQEGRTLTVRFEDDRQRMREFVTWSDQRDRWAAPEIEARRAMACFENFYSLYTQLEKDGEGLELVVADGHILWQANSSLQGSIKIHHPILLKRVELRFDPNIPEFTVHETDREPELFGSMFVDLENLSPGGIRNRNLELASAGYHPMGWGDTEAFLKAFIQTVSPSAGEFLDVPPLDGPTATPRLYRDTVLILRKRVMGISNAVDAILDDIEQDGAFPPALSQITGAFETAWSGTGFGGPEEGEGGAAQPRRFDDDGILLAKEANEEQLQIIRRLEQSGSVLVQGPPGTGKTHTIGNLIGHLLAQGKSILVTAQTAKALRVLHDQIPEMLQPLAVSVLGSDQLGRRQLESSIRSITERLTRDTPASLLRRAKEFEQDRRNLLTQSRLLSGLLREALENEYREIEVGGRRFSPSEAARFVSANQVAHGWIPSPVTLGADPGLTPQELARIYALGKAFSPSEEADARLSLPDLSTLPSERQFEVMTSEYRSLVTADLSLGANLWLQADRARDSVAQLLADHWPQADGASESIAQLLADLESEFADDLRSQTWRPYAIVAGIHGGQEREVWERLIASVEGACKANSGHALVLHHQPRLSGAMTIHRQYQITVEIQEHLKAGGKLGVFQLMTRSEWRQFIKTAAVTAGEPVHLEHFEALERLASLEHARANLGIPWNQLIGVHTRKSFKSLGAAPEMACRPLLPEIRRCLDWHSKVWTPLVARMKAEGLKFDTLLASIPPEASPISEYLSIEKLATSLLPPLLDIEIKRRKLRECDEGFARLRVLATDANPESPGLGAIGKVLAAVDAKEPSSYIAALEYVRRLQAIRPLALERDELIKRLALVAPTWAELIAQRVPPHHNGTLPNDVGTAWTLRQLHDTLAERDRLDAHDLQIKLDSVRENLRKVTQWLIDARAWGKQLERLQGSQAVRQALVGWLDAQKRLVGTRQADKRQTLLAEAQKSMRMSVAAVPVWIMPISIMAESFDPRTTRFDVVIIDEASQADLNALIPLYLGKQVIVVGDHEQVTPLGVGKDQTILENLRKSLLQGIPNSHLFDNLCSIYDIGRQSFGSAISLVEHFRCVPEIIAFSNQLSYDGKIRPLRESNSSELKPACVANRVLGVREGDINKAEADRILNLMKAMLRHPKYVGKSMGVISMLGTAQSAYIQSRILKEIPTTEIERRRILAGISGEFQGDERDVVFLSLVDSTVEDTGLRAVGDGAFESMKKRYNVAASRARDQLWVVHSFDHELHLKASDLRFKLLQHIHDPWSTVTAYNQEVGKAESPFEKEVLRRLTGAGYRVKSQWRVGYYRIDMVVEGGGRRLAVECDGDRYHPIEKLAEDMERQAVLERLGWQFARIRGTAYYRNPDEAMKPVFQRLEEMDIPPELGLGEATPDADRTLLHELDAMIEEGRVEDENMMDAEMAHPEESASGLSIGGDPDQVVAILKGIGGLAPIEDFLRELAKVNGYQRLGKNVRGNLMAELDSLVRMGVIAHVGGIVRLL